MPQKPQKPSPKRRRRVAGIRPAATPQRQVPDEDQQANPPEAPEPGDTGAETTAAEEPRPAEDAELEDAELEDAELEDAEREDAELEDAGREDAEKRPVERADPSGSDEPEPEGAAGSDAAGPPASRPPRTLAAVLTVVAFLLAGFAAVAAVRWGAASETTNNRALTDAETTKQVTTQVSGALNTLLSFDYKHPDKHQGAAKKLIAGKLADCSGSSGKVGYGKLIGVLRAKGPKAKLSLKSTTLATGVQQLRGDRAQVLVLLEQRYSKGSGKAGDKGADQSSVLTAATVNAIDKNGRWQLTALCLQ